MPTCTCTRWWMWERQSWRGSRTCERARLVPLLFFFQNPLSVLIFSLFYFHIHLRCPSALATTSSRRRSCQTSGWTSWRLKYNCNRLTEVINLNKVVIEIRIWIESQCLQILLKLVDADASSIESLRDVGQKLVEFRGTISTEVTTMMVIKTMMMVVWWWWSWRWCWW